MKCLCNIKCRNIKDVDMFGKDPELYYQGQRKKAFWIGRILSCAFMLIYFFFLLYKILRMINKTDVIFYDTFSYSPTPPTVKINNNNFYIAFALEDPVTYDPFINERIYYPKAYFKRGEMTNDGFVWSVIELEIERCKKEKFGESFQEVFKNLDSDNFYCFKDIDNFILEGHYTYYLYSFFYIEFYPCVNFTLEYNEKTNTTIKVFNKNTCESLEKIDYYLKNTFVSLNMEDIELNPKSYDHPTRPRNAEVYTTVGKKLFQEIHTFFEIVNIETDESWLGFEYENIKTQKYLKYDETFIMSNLIENNIYKTGEKFADLTIKLSENIRTQRRVYTKLINILSDIGGLMEVVFTIFRIFSSFSVDILYEISLVNRLFNFDILERKVIIKCKEKENEEKDDTTVINKKENSSISIEPINISNNLQINQSNNAINNFSFLNINNNYVNKNRIKSMKSNRSKSVYLNDGNSNLNSLNIVKNKYNLNKFDILGKKFDKKEESSDISSSENKNKNLIKRLRFNKACIYLCFCCVRRQKSIQNILLNEGMDLISQRLDIFNIFEKMYKYEQKNEPLDNRIIPMSYECRRKIRDFVKSLPIIIPII